MTWMPEKIEKKIFYKILLLEDCYGMYNTKFEKGSLLMFDKENEDSYILIAGHGDETWIPKSKARRIKYQKIITIERWKE